MKRVIVHIGSIEPYYSFFEGKLRDGSKIKIEGKAAVRVHLLVGSRESADVLVDLDSGESEISDPQRIIKLVEDAPTPAQPNNDATSTKPNSSGNGRKFWEGLEDLQGELISQTTGLLKEAGNLPSEVTREIQSYLVLEGADPLDPETFRARFEEEVKQFLIERRREVLKKILEAIELISPDVRAAWAQLDEILTKEYRLRRLPPDTPTGPVRADDFLEEMAAGAPPDDSLAEEAEEMTTEEEGEGDTPPLELLTTAKPTAKPPVTGTNGG